MVVTSRRPTLAGELLVLQLAIVVVVLVAVAAVSLAQSKATFDRVEGRRVTALAEEMAGNPLLRTQLVLPAPGEVLAPLLQTTRTRSNVASDCASETAATATSTTTTMAS